VISILIIFLCLYFGWKLLKWIGRGVIYFAESVDDLTDSAIDKIKPSNERDKILKSLEEFENRVKNNQ